MESVPAAARPRKSRKVPEYLVYEIMDGQPLYRKGYKAVLDKTTRGLTMNILSHLQKKGLFTGE